MTPGEAVAYRIKTGEVSQETLEAECKVLFRSVEADRRYTHNRTMNMSKVWTSRLSLFVRPPVL